ncbi:MAG: hypothetical protein UFG06_09920 [Lachnospiraceae bacterium]|nr:hypothetical protein [Lachnospiraceae bacterium]
MKIRKKGWFLFWALLIAAIGVTAYSVVRKEKNSVQENVVTVKAEDGEKIIYATLYTVRGNEITYYPQENENTDTGQAVQTSLIPVGTPVTTRLGTVTTFSRLAAGDNVALVTDEENGEIEAVYIIEQKRSSL